MRIPARVVIGVAVLGAVGACLETPSSGYEPEWNQPARPHQIIGGVHFVGTTELAAFLITTPRGHILIDPGFEETVPHIKRAVQELGFDYRDISVLLTTHAHREHAGALALIKEETGARVEAMAGDAELLESGGRDDFLFGNTRRFPPVLVTRVLQDRDTIEQGNVRLTAYHTPGHTPGATSYTMVASDEGWAHLVVFTTSLTVDPGTALVDNARYPDIVADWERTYATLDRLSAGVWLAPHTGAFDMEGKRARLDRPGNPYVDPAGYRRYLADSRQQFGARLATQIAGQ